MSVTLGTMAPNSGERAGGARRDDTTAAVDAVRRIVRALRLAARRVESEAGISAAQLFALSELAAEPASSLSDLAARTLTDRSSVTAVVERLAERGLVERARAEEDRRRDTVRLTPRGRALVRRLPAAPTQELIAALGRLSDEELRAVAHGLTRLTEEMGLADQPAPMLFEDAEPEAAPARRAPRAAARRPRRRASG